MSASMDIFVPNVSTTYTITGANCQVLTVKVPPGTNVVSEPGTMLYKSTNMKSSVECGSCQRVCVGESICKAIQTNSGTTDGFVGLTPNVPAKIVPINLSDVGGKIILKVSGGGLDRLYYVNQ